MRENSTAIVVDNIGTQSGMHELCMYMKSQMDSEGIHTDLAYPGHSLYKSFYGVNMILQVWRFFKFVMLVRRRHAVENYTRIYLNYYGTMLDRIMLNSLAVTDVILHELKYIDDIKSEVRVPKKFRKLNIYVMNTALESSLRNYRIHTTRVDHPVIYGLLERKTLRKGILLPGNLRRTKGYQRILLTLKNTDIPITIIGRDREGLVAELKGIRDFIYIDYISDEDLKQALVDFEFVVLPYEKVNQSGLLDMAIGLGVRCICSDISYFAIKQERYPRLLKTYSVEDPNSLINALSYNDFDFNAFVEERNRYISDSRFSRIWRKS